MYNEVTMTHEQFVFWLRGFLQDRTELPAESLKTILKQTEHLYTPTPTTITTTPGWQPPWNPGCGTGGAGTCDTRPRTF